MKKYIYEGKSVDQTLNLALYELNVNNEDLVYSVKEEKAGLLKGKKYLLECIKIDDIIIYTKELLQTILDSMNIESKIETKYRDNIININIHSNNNSILIGKKGHILDALQTYTRQAVFNEVGKYIQISIDVENYKDKQAYFLRRDAKKIAKEVIKTKIDVKLDPMKAYERKIIHDALNNYKNIKTESEGIEPNRYIVIKYKD